MIFYFYIIDFVYNFSWYDFEFLISYFNVTCQLLIIWKECISYISVHCVLYYWRFNNRLSMKPMPCHQFVIKFSQACIFDVFIWIVCHHHQTNKSIFLLMGKSSWDPQNTNTMHYKCCYASINMLYKKRSFLLPLNICYDTENIWHSFCFVHIIRAFSDTH